MGKSLLDLDFRLEGHVVGRSHLICKGHGGWPETTKERHTTRPGPGPPEPIVITQFVLGSGPSVLRNACEVGRPNPVTLLACAAQMLHDEFRTLGSQSERERERGNFSLKYNDRAQA